MGIEAERKVDTLNCASKGTFEVHNLASMVQCHVFIEDEIMAPPNLPDKSTTAKPPKLLDQVRDKLRVKHYRVPLKITFRHSREGGNPV